MSFADTLLLLAAIAPVFAARWNATAAALAGQYFVLRGIWWTLGIDFPARVQFLFDVTVIAVIYCKAPARDCWPYLNWRHQLLALWHERSLWDRVVIAIFPAMWAAYVLPLSDYHRWWALYWLAIAQFIAAGIEAANSYLSTRSAKAGDARPDFTGMEFTARFGRRGYG